MVYIVDYRKNGQFFGTEKEFKSKSEAIKFAREKLMQRYQVGLSTKKGNNKNTLIDW